MRKYARFLIVAGLFQGCLFASESDQVDPMRPEAQVQIEIINPIYRNPINKDNCDVWVEMRYEKTFHISDTSVKVLDSKPPGEYDDVALEVLLSFLSDGQHSPINSTVGVKHNDDGSTEQFFTFFKGCDRRVVTRE